MYLPLIGHPIPEQFYVITGNWMFYLRFPFLNAKICYNATLVAEMCSASVINHSLQGYSNTSSPTSELDEYKVMRVADTTHDHIVFTTT